MAGMNETSTGPHIMRSHHSSIGLASIPIDEGPQGQGGKGLAVSSSAVSAAKEGLCLYTTTRTAFEQAQSAVPALTND